MEGTPFGRYRLIDLLGRGGMGDVWRAHDTVTDRVVAIKMLPAQYSDDPTFQQRFRREAQAAARLNSPHVIPIYDYGEIDGRLFVSMRLVEGRDLQAVLTDGPLPPSRAVRIIEQVAKALHAAHKVGLVHRDVKPSNVLLDEDDFAYLIDFGIARATDDTRMTGTSTTIGTWAYMAPERFRPGPIETSVDVYALACVLHECLTGELPFPGDSLEHFMFAHISDPPPRPSQLRASVPAAMDIVIADGMAKKPEQRYRDTRELATAARAALTTPRSSEATTRPTHPATEAVPPESDVGWGVSSNADYERLSKLTGHRASSTPAYESSQADPFAGRSAPPQIRRLWTGLPFFFTVLIVVIIAALVTTIMVVEASRAPVEEPPATLPVVTHPLPAQPGSLEGVPRLRLQPSHPVAPSQQGTRAPATIRRLPAVEHEYGVTIHSDVEATAKRCHSPGTPLSR